MRETADRPTKPFLPPSTPLVCCLKVLTNSHATHILGIFALHVGHTEHPRDSLLPKCPTITPPLPCYCLPFSRHRSHPAVDLRFTLRDCGLHECAVHVLGALLRTRRKKRELRELRRAFFGIARMRSRKMRKERFADSGYQPSQL